MNGGLRLSIAGVMLGLLALAGCGRGFFQGGERAPWRHEAEVACMKSGAVKLGAAVVQIEPIEGPGMCGADFPLKVAALGEPTAAMSYSDDLVPPASIPNASARMPNWPPQRYAPPPARVEVAPGRYETMQWQTGPQPAAAAPPGEPMSLDPPTIGPGAPMRAVPSAPSARPVPAQTRVMPDDIPPDAEIPPGGSAAVPQQRVQPAYPAQRNAYNAPVYEPPRLGPSRPPFNTAAVAQAALSPPATLACPLVSALDRWVSEGVQPAALRWFGSPVVSIKQISAYACRGMVGSGTHSISEHAFGNALDVAGFTLADGRTITVVNGWHGSPEEQGFLHDVQLYACETFTTVLAPGYNAAHYNHIHVDLMRRASGRMPCRPNAIPGEVVAAKVRARYASKHGPAYTGSIASLFEQASKMPAALPGEDGEDDDDGVTGSIPEPAAEPKKSGGMFDDAIGRLLGRTSTAAPPSSARTADRQTQGF
jgi:hypothetical protein